MGVLDCEGCCCCCDGCGGGTVGVCDAGEGEVDSRCGTEDFQRRPCGTLLHTEVNERTDDMI